MSSALRGPLDDVELQAGSRPDEVRLDVVITGLLDWLLRDYVADLGASLQPDGWLRGTGWRARVMPAEDFVRGRIRVGQVRLEVEGQPEAVDHFRQALAPKLMRGGG